MEFDGTKIKRMYWQDSGLVLVFLVFTWWVLGYVLMDVSSLAENLQIREVALAAGSLAVIFVTSSLIAVLVHLKKNRDALYYEELLHSARQYEKI